MPHEELHSLDSVTNHSAPSGGAVLGNVPKFNATGQLIDSGVKPGGQNPFAFGDQYPEDASQDVNMAQFEMLGLPFTIQEPASVTHVRVDARNSGNNMKVGIYRWSDGVKVAESISTLIGATGIQQIALSASWAATKGRYILVVMWDAANQKVKGRNTDVLWKNAITQTELVFTLPDPLTTPYTYSAIRPALQGVISGVQ